jgi:hypothetical protein
MLAFAQPEERKVHHMNEDITAHYVALDDISVVRNEVAGAMCYSA